MPGELCALLLVELTHRDHADVVLGQGSAQALFEAAGQPPAQIQYPLADQGDRLGGDTPVVTWVLHACVDLVAQAGDAHHVELVEVGRVDRAELHALEQRNALVLGQLQHPLVEVKP